MAPDVKYFDSENFEDQWARSSAAQKALMVEQSAHLSPAKGIGPALEGYLCPHARVSDRAAAALKTLVAKIPRTDPGNSEGLAREMQVSAGVASRIYGKLASQAHGNQKAFLFTLLAGMGGHGPGAAFMAITRGHIPPEKAQGLVLKIAEPARLDLTNHYIQAAAEIRLSLAPLFTTILDSVKSRPGVISFFADLFDRGRDADPFLHNIRPRLRAPEPILEKEMPWADTGRKVVGLKALSMLANQIPPPHLLPFLTADSPPQIRTVVYQIIENATPGIYAELFDPILDVIPDIEEAEALQAVKALAASGRHPMFHLLEMIQDRHPDLMPAIKEEVSHLSKTGFLFIQDMALNPERYRDGIHLEINLACIFGMIKKRPERVAAVFRHMAGNATVPVPENVTRFLSHVKHLLAREKKDIAAAFLPAIARHRSAASRKKTSGRPKHSETDLIRSRDFSGQRIEETTRGFRDKTIDRCSFSGASLTSLSFDGAQIFDTDFGNAVFDSVSFDRSVWINVDARKAVFRNCRFDSALICNSDFTNAVIIDAFFTNADIAGTHFNNTDFSFSSFAFAKLSGVFLDKARTCSLDFSGVRARFSRFPPPDLRTVQTGDMDYNARKFQPDISQLPPLNPDLVRKINMLIFCEFTHYGEAKFLRQNRLSLITALDIFSPAQADLFRMIPVLIHDNLTFPLTGTVPEQTPCGISGFVPSTRTLDLIASYSQKPSPAGSPHPSPAIHGLYTIGSVGSVAQTSDSDIDYWVCIRESELGSHGLGLLESKLAMLETMAKAHFHTQVTFFIVDITRVKANDFGDSTMESSGSAQAGLLKEEFYRTMIHLAGKLPLWTVLPTAISRRYYPAVAKRVAGSRHRYLDLGDIHEISSGEYFGASVWQMFKWIKSPFKSILKMALLEKYFFESGESLLLCNQYKNEWMNTGSRLKLAQNDAYYFLMKHLIRFYKANRDPHSVNLLLTCFFLKLKVSKSSHLDQTPFGIRRILLLKCLEAWGWDIKKVHEVGSINTWPYKNIVRLSRALEAFILKKYKKVTASCEQKGILDSMISPEDRTVLEHKVKIEFSRQPMKVRKVLLVSRGDRHFTRLFLKCCDAQLPGGKWALLNHHQDLADELILQAATIEEIGAWLVVNGLFSGKTRIRLLSSPFPVTEEEIHTLFRSLLDFFSPRLKHPVPFFRLLSYPEKKAVFTSVNFYAPRADRTITHYTALYINGWNEVFCQSGYALQGFMSMAHVRRDLMFRLRMPRLPDPAVFFFPGKTKG